MEPKTTGAQQLFELLDQSIRTLYDSIDSNEVEGYVSYKALGMSYAFMRIRPRKNHLIVRLAIPFNQIHDPRDICREGKPSKWSREHSDVRFRSSEDIGDIM